MDNDQREECSICLSALQFPLGTIDSCGHVFCFSCIKLSASTSSLCPLCRREFKKIIKVDPSGKSRKGIKNVIRVSSKRLAVDPDDENIVVAPYSAVEHTISVALEQSDIRFVFNFWNQGSHNHSNSEPQRVSSTGPSSTHQVDDPRHVILDDDEIVNQSPTNSVIIIDDDDDEDNSN